MASAGALDLLATRDFVLEHVTPCQPLLQPFRMDWFAPEGDRPSPRLDVAISRRMRLGRHARAESRLPVSATSATIRSCLWAMFVAENGA